MVIGNGMIAKAFSHFSGRQDTLIFASGVSKSKETQVSEFERELTLVTNSIRANPDKVFVYFSTCSINNCDTPYTKHKSIVEKLIQKNCKKYLILRLPIVIGPHQNKDQLIGHLFNKLNTGEEITIFKKANRFLIDSEDIPKIVEYLIESGMQNETIDVAFNNSISIEDLVSLIETIFNKKFIKKHFIDQDSVYIVNNNRFLSLINKSEDLKLTYSIRDMLIKYYT